MRSRDDLLRDPEACWSPWQPTGSDPWDEAKAAHLHRRAGLGGDLGPGPPRHQRRLRARGAPRPGGETHGPDGRPAAEFAEIVEAMVASARREPSIERVQYLWFFRLIFSPHALAERMTLVWHGHYATSNQKVNNPLWMLDQNLVPARALAVHESRSFICGCSATGDARLARRPGQPKVAAERKPRPRIPRVLRPGRGKLLRGGYPRRRPSPDWMAAVTSSPDGILFDEDEHDAGSKTLLGQTGPWGA